MSVQVASSPLLKREEAGTQDAYLAGLLEQCQRQKQSGFDSATSSWLQALRNRTASWVEQQRLPTKRDEEWRFTDLSSLLQVNFQIATQVTVEKSAVEALILPEAAQSQIVFVNGRYAPQLSDVSSLPAGVFVGSLAQLPETQRTRIQEYLGQQEGAQELFSALNTTGFTDAAIIWADPNAIVETPIHLLFLSVADDSPTFSLPRALVVAERGSSLEIIEHFADGRRDAYPTTNYPTTKESPDIPANRPYFTNVVTEIWVEENAQVNHIRIQRESEDGIQIGRTAIAQARDSRYTCNAISLGAKLSRHNLEVWQTGEQIDTNLYGLTVIGDQQLADTHSRIALAKPHGTTNQLHKCIIDDRAHAVFNGKVLVPKAAQLTNAAQLNRNLLLSPKARINTKPELQITADNVQCTHGATISQLKADEVFYLRSRGLSESDARHLLIDAFAAEILDRITVASLRTMLSQYVACRTP